MNGSKITMNQFPCSWFGTHKYLRMRCVFLPLAQNRKLVDIFSRDCTERIIQPVMTARAAVLTSVSETVSWEAVK